MLNDKLAKSNRKFLDRLMLVLAFILFIVAPAVDVMAGDLRVGALIGSNHFGDGNWNEDQNGWYLGVNGFTYGEYDNSYSGRDGHGKLTSRFVTYEQDFKGYEDRFSWQVGVVDGYPDEAFAGADLVPWVSLNIKIGVPKLSAKAWFVPAVVVAHGVESRWYWE